MLKALHEIVDLNSLLFIDDYKNCPECQKAEWRPSPIGRHHTHRHDELTARVIPHLGVLVREHCKSFKTDNEGLNHLLISGLEFAAIDLELREYHQLKNLPNKNQSARLLVRRLMAREAELEARVKELEAQLAGRCVGSPTQEVAPLQDPFPTEETDKGPDLWTPLAEPLKERVSEKNFEIWLSSVRFFSADESRLVLHVPNTFFQEYLAEHYTEVIEEELQKMGFEQKVSFEVCSPTPQEALPNTQEPAKEAEPKEEEPRPVLSPMSSKRARREADREALKERCCIRLSSGKWEFIIADYTSKLKLLEADEADEDRREKIEELRRAKDTLEESKRDQRARRSHFWSDDKTTPKKIRQLVDQLERDNKKGPHTPKRE